MLEQKFEEIVKKLSSSVAAIILSVFNSNIYLSGRCFMPALKGLSCSSRMTIAVINTTKEALDRIAQPFGKATDRKPL
jgi:galactokinase/mevalonate kinase-like predicted kinase